MKSTNDILYEGYLARKVEEAGKIKYYMVKSIVDVLDWYYKKDPSNFDPRQAQNVRELINAYMNNTYDVLMKAYHYTPDSFNDTWNKEEEFNKKVNSFAKSVIVTYLKDYYSIDYGPVVGNTVADILFYSVDPTAAFNEWKQADKEIQKGIQAAGANLDF